MPRKISPKRRPYTQWASGSSASIGGIGSPKGRQSSRFDKIILVQLVIDQIIKYAVVIKEMLQTILEKVVNFRFNLGGGVISFGRDLRFCVFSVCKWSEYIDVGIALWKALEPPEPSDWGLD